jgi:hypothetical protein
MVSMRRRAVRGAHGAPAAEAPVMRLVHGGVQMERCGAWRHASDRAAVRRRTSVNQCTPWPLVSVEGSAPRRRIAVSHIAAGSTSKIRSSSMSLISQADCASSSSS